MPTPVGTDPYQSRVVADPDNGLTIVEPGDPGDDPALASPRMRKEV